MNMTPKNKTKVSRASTSNLNSFNTRDPFQKTRALILKPTPQEVTDSGSTLSKNELRQD